MELIDKGYLRKMLMYDGQFEMTEESYKKVIELIDEAPSVDATPVIHGCWMPAKKEMTIGIFNGRQCSVCKKIYVGKPENGGNYCENCGAKMDKEGEV